MVSAMIAIDGERQPELPGHQDREHAQDDDRDDGPQLPDPHPRVGGQLGQAAPALADAGLRALGLLDRRLTTGFHSGFGGSARSAGGSPAAAPHRKAPADVLRPKAPRRAPGRGPVPQRQVGRLGFGRRGLRARRLRLRATSAAVPSAVAASSAACPGQVTGASRTGGPGPASAPSPFSPSGPLGPEERQASRTFRRTLGCLSLRPCPVVCCPAVIACRHQRT